MRIADLPATDRPRERLHAHGPGALADRELLAILLGTGAAPGRGAHQLAAQLLARYGSLAALARAHPAELTTVHGVGPAKAALLAAAGELARRSQRPTAPPVIRGTSDIVSVAGPLLYGRNRERLALVVCDSRNRVTSCEVISEGGAGRTLLPIREIAVAVLRRDGAAFALAHNHPDGDVTPSAADRAATARIADVANATDLRFLDHVVVTDTQWRRIA
ncbi:DNA repair protein RadC [Pilimelia anulata]|uniref:DNA repair protein RadC n=1 Tax=Pilimelia anulata TaxID=53371 RepID=A0A8J3F704_9ACTN|nr:DNA repair protein RadC [Pilimelia anulata]GGJ74216.1 DNA repair protein RadC [Pilimelia anulata]